MIRSAAERSRLHELITIILNSIYKYLYCIFILVNDMTNLWNFVRTSDKGTCIFIDNSGKLFNKSINLNPFLTVRFCGLWPFFKSGPFLTIFTSFKNPLTSSFHQKAFWSAS
ncbi:hypothetical protein DSECCO2_521040 [anaerobic digester metagenome]